MWLKQTFAPTVEPVLVADLVAHLQLGELPEDQIGLAENMLAAARQYVENRIRRQLITATYAAYFDEFPDEFIINDKLPFGSLTSIAYVDDQGTAQTLSATLYQTQSNSQNRPARIMPAYGQSWPSLRTGVYNAVTVTFTAGYGATAATVPVGIRHAILMAAGTWFSNREDMVVGTINSRVEFGIAAALEPFDWGFYG